jgi:pentose-5-phosphate-3-epimerase
MEKIDFVQFMGSDTLGRHGVDLDPRVLGKISALRKRYPKSIIGIDIGVNEETAPDLV